MPQRQSAPDLEPGYKPPETPVGSSGLASSRCSDDVGAVPSRGLQRHDSALSSGLSMEQREDLPQRKQIMRMVTKAVNECVMQELAMVGEMVTTAVQREARSHDQRIKRLEARLEAQLQGSQLIQGSPNAQVPTDGHGADASPVVQRVLAQLHAVDSEMSSLGRQLQENVESLREELRLLQLRGSLQGVANGMLALSSPDLTLEEKDLSMKTLKQEEASLRQRLSRCVSEAVQSPRSSVEGPDSPASSSPCTSSRSNRHRCGQLAPLGETTAMRPRQRSYTEQLVHYLRRTGSQ
mmetsp:Transcript_88501/g.250870  ORF Transcript_88501/g.250870 Transcript_88501/m.250870 type:complete len:294 (-) Transcript_88501:441-1322(-)